MAKQTQSAVGYVAKTPRENERCGQCSMFRPPYGCTAVAGHIKPGGWCELFERKERASGGMVQGFAEGGAPAFDPDAYLKTAPAAPAFDPDAYLKKGAPPEPSVGDHALKATKDAVKPFTSYPSTYMEENRKTREQMARGVGQITGSIGEGSWWDRIKGVANVGLGGLGYASSPITAGLRTVVGQPLEEVTGIPKEYSEFAAGLIIPGYGLTRVRGASAPTTAVTAPHRFPDEIPSAEYLANRYAGTEFKSPLSRGQASRDLEQIRFEDMASRQAYGKPAQEVAAPWFERQYGLVQEDVRDIGEKLARGSPTASIENAAGRVADDVASRAAAARAEREAAERALEQETAAARGMVDDEGRALTRAIEGGHLPIENPREAGEIVGHAVREGARESRAGARQAYDRAFGLPGQFHAGAFEGVGTRIQGGLTLGDSPVIIDDITTPLASRAIRDLDNISRLRIQNRADPFGAPNPENIVAVDLRGVDQARKRLVSFYKDARSSGKDADVRATGRVIDEFDNAVEQAISNGLFSGDPRALEALQQARAAYSRYARTYRPQFAGDDVGLAMRRIIDRNATPEEIANMLIGFGRIGQAGLPVRLAERLEQALGAGSDAWSAVRQAVWQRASHMQAPGGGVDPGRASQSILDFTHSSLARRLFTQQEIAGMRGYARGVRELDETIAALPEAGTVARRQASYQELFGAGGIGGEAGTIFRRMVDGTATPEEVARGVLTAIGNGNPGNTVRMINAIERIAGPGSETMAAIRQGVWEQLAQAPAGLSQPGLQRLSTRIGDFLDSTIAQRLYNPEELALMKRFGDHVKLMVIPKYSRTNSDTAVAISALLQKMQKYGAGPMTGAGALIDYVAGMGGPLGALAGYSAKKGLDDVADRLVHDRFARKLRRAMPMPSE